MAPSPRRVLAIAWLLFWALMVAVQVQQYVRDGGKALWQPVLWELSSMVAATLLLVVHRRLARRHDHLLARPWRWFGVRALFLPMYWVAFVPIAFGIRHAVYALAGQRFVHGPWGEVFLYESVKLTVFICLFVLIEFGLLSYLALMQEKLRAEQANALLREAQLKQLAGQMQPHFLFNALNTISSLMHSDVERADATLIQLAEVLRATLEAGQRHEAPLAAELRLARAYARVMEERHAGRVTVGWDIDERLLDVPVPVMCLQPLLENVFKHTVERRREPTAIAVRVWCDGGSVALSVRDDGGTLALAAGDGNGGLAAGAAPGIGLANLRARLEVLHGGAASVVLRQLAPRGVDAQLRLPCAC